MLDDTTGAPAAPAAESDDGFWSDAPAPEATEQPGQPPAAPAAPVKGPSVTELLEGAPAQPDKPAPAAQPAVPASTPASAAPAAAAPAAAPSTPAAPQSWTFRADNDEITVDGSQIHPDGSLTIPAKHREQIEQLLAEGVAHRGSWRGEQEQYEGRIAQLEEQLASQQPELVRAKAFSDSILALLAKGPDAVADWLDNHATNFPKFQADAEVAVLRQQLSERDQRLSRADEERLSQELAPQLQNTVAQAVTEMAGQFPGVDAQKLHQRITTRFLDQVAYEVPAAQRARGLQRGEVLIGRGPKDELYIVNTGLIRDEFAYQADLLKGSAAAAGAAVAQNAAVAQPGAGVAPAVPALGGVPPNLAEGEMPKFATRKEMEDWIESGAWRGLVFKER